MSLFRSSQVRHDELQRALACLPAHELGVPFDENLALWRKWYAEGALQLGWVETLGPDAGGEVQCLGVTLWITDHAVRALAERGEGTAAQRICLAERAGAADPAWVMDATQIGAAHTAQTLNLLVIHFWTRRAPFEPDFQPVFVQSYALFKEQHQGYGVRQMLQEVPLYQADILKAGGLKTVRADAPDASLPLALLGLNREEAHATPGSSLAFLFFSPPSRLGLRPSIQRMLGLALRQLTDDDIAQALSCSRDYVRKLWGDVYENLDQAGVLQAGNPGSADSNVAPRGRERRRLALEFFRANPQELRPGMPDQVT